ncbi:hypothetical protein ZWY2020_014678 [Hordeum vulgare]|nr:hypothetical protein ZWY2020_014678 [Hordeum vulgare]
MLRGGEEFRELVFETPHGRAEKLLRMDEEERAAKGVFVGVSLLEEDGGGFHGGSVRPGARGSGCRRASSLRAAGDRRLMGGRCVRGKETVHGLGLS